jgi:hypothetical protein
MRLVVPTLVLPLLAAAPMAAQSVADAYGPVAERIITAALGDSSAYARLTELVDRFGPRFSGTASAGSR